MGEPRGRRRTEFSAIHLDGMESLVSDVSSGSRRLLETVESLQAQAHAASVSTPALAKIAEIGSWGQDQLPHLKRRLVLASARSGHRAKASRSSRVREPLGMSKKDAEAKGRAFGKTMREATSGDAKQATLWHRVLKDLQKYRSDPDVLSAFIAELGPQATQLFPRLLEGTGSKTAAQDLELMSKLFAGAFKDRDPAKGFDAVKQLFLKQPPDDKVRSIAWDRLAMLQYGDFPRSFVEGVVRNNGLKLLSKIGDDQRWDTRNGRQTGLPPNIMALLFRTISGDPTLARDVFKGLDLTTVTKAAYGAFDGEVKVAFAKAMLAATGSGGDEKAGDHSRAAAEFTFRFMQASGSVEKVPSQLKKTLGKIAAKWAPELVTGSYLADAGDRASSLTRPPNFDRIPGVDPMFFLSPKDTYRFLHGIGSDDKYTDEFDGQVQRLYESTLGAVTKLKKADPNDARWSHALAAYGYLAGLEFAAQRDVRGKQDELDKKSRQLLSTVFGVAVGEIPGGSGLAKLTWKVAKFGLAQGQRAWVKGDAASTRKALLEDSEAQASFLVRYQLAARLVDAHYPGTGRVPDELMTKSGHLKSPKAIVDDPKLVAAYIAWTDSTDGGKDSDLDNVLDEGDRNVRGAHDEAAERAKKYGY